LNEQFNHNFTIETYERCKWLHPFTFQRCNLNKTYINDQTYYHNCKKHIYKLPYVGYYGYNE
jgi:hypothetical protein